MNKRSLHTVVTPLPPTVTRDIGVAMLHNHDEMIELNPLVIEHHPTKPPKHAEADEFHCAWHSLTDRLSYLPGGMVKGQVTYYAAFHDMPWGIQTHIYAPMGTEIRNKWSIGGNAPGEAREILEIGLKGVPRDGLYLREDCDLRCNIALLPYVKRQLKKSHQVLVERLLSKGEVIEDRAYRQNYNSVVMDQSDASSLGPRASLSPSLGSTSDGSFRTPAPSSSSAQHPPPYYPDGEQQPGAPSQYQNYGSRPTSSQQTYASPYPTGGQPPARLPYPTHQSPGVGQGPFPNANAYSPEQLQSQWPQDKLRPAPLQPQHRHPSNQAYGLPDSKQGPPIAELPDEPVQNELPGEPARHELDSGDVTAAVRPQSRQ